MKFLLIDFGASYIKSVIYNKDTNEFSYEKIIQSPFSKTDILSRNEISESMYCILDEYKTNIDYIFTCSIIGGFYSGVNYYTWKCNNKPEVPNNPQCLIGGLLNSDSIHNSHSKVFNLEGNNDIKIIGKLSGIPVLTSLSDTYCAIKSVNLDNNMIINLGTGSQVFYFNKSQSYIPSGRSLLYIQKFFKDINENIDIFKDMNKINLKSVLKGSIKINLNFFKQNYRYTSGGSIEFIKDNFNYCNFISSLLKSYVEQYFEFIDDYLKNENASKNIFLLGGIPNKNKTIIEYFKYKYPECNFFINERIDTHLGLAKIILNENISYR
jgi:hypothetical protein